MAVVTRNFEVAVQRIDFPGRSLSEGELVDSMGKVVCVVVDHQGQMGVTARKWNGTTRCHVEVTGHFPDFD